MKLLDQVRHVIRKKHYSIRTEQAYTDWIKRFILFHGKRHPKDMVCQPVLRPVIGKQSLPHEVYVYNN